MWFATNLACLVLLSHKVKIANIQNLSLVYVVYVLSTSQQDNTALCEEGILVLCEEGIMG